MLNKAIYLSLFILLASCSDDANKAKQQAASSTEPALTATHIGSDVYYRMISSEEGEDDSSLPQGYWQSIISYPEIYGAITEPVQLNVNRHIINLSKEYSCEKHGDYAFSSKVITLNTDMFSMSYEIMWMCPKMASPDSTVGALNYNLQTGEELKLQTEFISNTTQTDFMSYLSTKLIEQHKANNNCPAKDKHSYFYITPKSLVFVIDVDRHDESGCITELELSKAELVPYLKPESLLLK